MSRTEPSLLVRTLTELFDTVVVLQQHANQWLITIDDFFGRG